MLARHTIAVGTEGVYALGPGWVHWRTVQDHFADTGNSHRVGIQVGVGIQEADPEGVDIQAEAGIQAAGPEGAGILEGLLEVQNQEVRLEVRIPEGPLEAGIPEVLLGAGIPAVHLEGQSLVESLEVGIPEEEQLQQRRRYSRRTC